MDILLHDIMVEPIGYCNLHCKMCYTRHSTATLPPGIIERVVDAYLGAMTGPIRLYWIGRGEVTLYKHLADLVNKFSERYPDRVSHIIQTNGIKIVEVAREFRRLDNVVVSVSLDGFEGPNDENRGNGTFKAIVAGIKQLVAMGVNTNVQSILTPHNVNEAREFEEYVHTISPGCKVQFLYPVTREDFEHANKEAVLDPSLTKQDILCIDEALDRPDLACIRASINRLWRTRYISVSCEGIVYNCCEFQVRIGDVGTNVESLIDRVKDDTLCKPCYLRKLCFPEHELAGSAAVHV